MKKTTATATCFHCGNAIVDKGIQMAEKQFCCNGCKTVFEILNENELCTYYDLNAQPGSAPRQDRRTDKFAFLDDQQIQKKLLQFQDTQQSQVTFYIPQIHCSSCLWLLENIEKVNPGIVSSRVNFTKKELFLVFQHQKTSLRQVVETLDQVGYEPHLSLNEVSAASVSKTDRKRWYKIGVAGFGFANIMMISLADYFAVNNAVDHKLDLFFKGLSILLSIPVLFYAAAEFFVTAYHGLKNKFLNIDFPVALALIITFARSLYEIATGIGNGYLDSMSGIVFFMLIGRWLQNRTYHTISFDRDYKSFFPIALNVIKGDRIIPTEIAKVKEKDVLQIHSNEIIPVDAILSKGNASIDYSFVSGESLPVPVQIGEIIYAGGKQLQGLLEVVVVKEVSQSYLTHLWNNPIFNQKKKAQSTAYDAIGKYFTYAVLALGFAAGIYWYFHADTQRMWNAITTVLIVACPCALLLSQNYTNGNILRIFGFNKFYLRSPEIIENLASIDHIVLDKTGTITHAHGANVKYSGQILTEQIKICTASVLKQSSHPASRQALEYLKDCETIAVENFKETEGAGIEAWVMEQHIKIGSPDFVGGTCFPENKSSKVVLSVDGKILGEFNISNKYRYGVTELLQKLRKRYSLSLLSGDNNGEAARIQELIGSRNDVFFNHNPQQKLEYIQSLQDKQCRVMMVGDGLNDAGALKQSDVGIAVADTGNNFTPASDGVIDSTRLTSLDAFLQLARTGKKIILFSFGISAVYNLIGLYFAMQGILSPVVAAILMPSSTLTIVLLTYGLTEFFAKKYNLKNYHKTA